MSRRIVVVHDHVGMNQEMQRRLENAEGDLSSAKKQWNTDGARVRYPASQHAGNAPKRGPLQQLTRPNAVSDEEQGAMCPK